MIKTLQFCLLLIAFNTVNAQIVLSENFSGSTGVGNSFNLTGWNQLRDNDNSFANGWTTDNGGAWVTDGYNNVGNTGAMRINMTNNVKRDFLITPVVDLSSTPSSGSYTVSWDMSFRLNNTQSAYQELNAGDEIRLLISTDSGATYTSLALIDSNTTLNTAGENISVEISDSTLFVNNVQFAFYAFESNITTLATNVFIDNFMIEDSSTLSTTDFTNPDAFDLYPNPTEDNLHVKGVELSEVQLYTILGTKVPVKYTGSTINTSALASGIYLVKLTDKKGNTETRKFIKK